MASLFENHIVRGGRRPLTKECATDEGYGHANRPLIRQIVAEQEKSKDYDPRYDFREGREERLEPWQLRRNFG